MIERVMKDVQGNVSKAARTLGISRTQLYGRLRKHGLNQALGWPSIAGSHNGHGSEPSQRVPVSGHKHTEIHGGSHDTR